MKVRTLLVSLAVAVAGAALLAWAFAPRPLQVEVARADRGRFEATIEEDARTRLRERYLVSAPLAGRLARIALHEGDAVAAGTVVAVLSPTLAPLLDERTVRGLQARVETAEAVVQRAGARIDRTKLSLQQARNDLDRSEQLAQRGFVSPTRLEADRLAVRAAQKEVEAAEQDRHVAGHELDQARAALGAVRQGPTSRPFELRAPVSGRVLRVMQTSEGPVAVGTPLMEIGDTAALEIVAELLTTDALRTKPGDPVRIDRWGGTPVLEGTVRRIEPAAFTKVSALGVEEQRVKVLIDLTSPPGEWRVLGDGYRVTARIVVQAVEDAVRVPVNAVFPAADAPAAEGAPAWAVFTVRDGRAQRVRVELGGRNARHAWIRAGLDADAPVIVYPPAALRDGMRVRERGTY